MKKINLGVIAPADIAKRRFLSALSACGDFELAGIAARSPKSEKKAADILKELGIERFRQAKVYSGYDAMLSDASVDAVYIPLPPALHFEWGKRALLAGKHVFMEKPFCTSLAETKELVDIAGKGGLALYENYGCIFHDQLRVIDEAVAEDQIGSIRLIRAAFGFPYRGAQDFRYEKNLGGGALLDAGGYCMKIARHFMAEDAEVVHSSLLYTEKHNCDMFGTVVMEDGAGLLAQLSFGMENQYKCELELWGTDGYILAPRIFTAPANLDPTITIVRGINTKEITARATDQFAECIKNFGKLIRGGDAGRDDREQVYITLLRGSRDIDEVFKKAER